MSIFSSAFRKQLLFLFFSVLCAGYAFAGGSGDFPDVSVAAYDAGSGRARIAIDWKKVGPDDKRQFGLYRSTGENADAYILLSTLDANSAVYADSGLTTDTEYHYIIGGALPRRELPQTKARGKKERRTESSTPQAALSYGKLPAGAVAWIPPDNPADQTVTQPLAGNPSPPPPSDGYQPSPSPSFGASSGADQPSPPFGASSGVYQLAPPPPSPPVPSGAYQPIPPQSGGYPSLPSQPVPPEIVQAPPAFPYRESAGTGTASVREPAFQNGGVSFALGFFSNRVFELTETSKPTVVSLVDNTAKSRLVSLLQQNYARSTLPGTALYYALHNAVNRINGWNATGALTNFDTVLLVTVTDGIDTASTDPALTPIDGLAFRNAETYQNFVKNAIENSRVGDKKITAVSIGVQGTDTVMEREYGSTLRAAANAEENVYRIPLHNLTKTLQSIAASVTSGTTVQPIGFVTPAYPDGTDIFIALDGHSTPSRGQNFIAGQIKVRGSQLVLENVTLGGLSKEAAALPNGSVTGRFDPNGSVEWQFNFPEVLNPAKVDLYYKTGKDWRASQEFAVRIYTPAASHRSALVYLLIDNSGSMTDRNITAIRDSATAFIEALSANPANIRPVYPSNAAFAMTRLAERPPVKPEIAAAQQPSPPQRERLPLPETSAQPPVDTDNTTDVWLMPVYDAVPEVSVPRIKPPAPATPPFPVMPQPVSGTKGYWVQASSSENRFTAEQIIEQLQQYQLAPVITEAQIRGKTFYRVRIGPYANLADASAVVDFVKKPPLGFYDSFIP